MNMTVVHNNDGIWSWVWLHFIQGALNEAVEALHVKRTFKNITVNNTLSRWYDDQQSFHHQKPVALAYSTVRAPKVENQLGRLFNNFQPMAGWYVG